MGAFGTNGEREFASVVVFVVEAVGGLTFML